jgi:hypothetical protein
MFYSKLFLVMLFEFLDAQARTPANAMVRVRQLLQPMWRHHECLLPVTPQAT